MGTRRVALASVAAATGAAGFGGCAAPGPATPDASRRVPLPGLGDAFVRVWEPTAAGQASAVALYLHGHGTDPLAQQDGLVAALRAEGWRVVAPVHLDARRPMLGNLVDRGGSFEARRAEVPATVAWIDATWPALPAVVVGYSFGTLFALGLAGAFVDVPDPEGRRVGLVPPWPRARAAVGFSSPGRLDVVDLRTGLATLKVPLLIVTGPNDNGGAAPHVAYAEAAPGALGRSLVVPESGHGLIDERSPAARAAIAEVVAFMRAALGAPGGPGGG